MRHIRGLSLGAKLNLALLSFLLVLGAAASGIIFYGFNRTQDDATERSQEALEEQGKLALLALVGGVSESGGLQVEWAAEIGHRASSYMEEFKAGAMPVEVDTSRFVRTENGVWYDPDAGRASDVVVPNHVEDLTQAHLEDITYSAALDPLFPALVEGFPGELSGEGFRPIAIIFVGINGVGRYYPPIGIQESTPSDLDVADFVNRFGPIVNPEHTTSWTPPYEDLNGRGLVITAQTPIYQGDTFRGIFEVDLSIDRLAEELNEINPTPGGFAFYVDTEGEIMRSAAFPLLTRESGENEELASILEAMGASPQGAAPIVEQVALDGREYFLAYTAMPAIGGSIAAAAPVDEVTAEAASITAGIDDEGSRTLRVMLVAMGGLFIAGLAAATTVNRRLLVRPLQQLAAATRQVAGGDLTVRVDADRHDELGDLASGFNVMVEQLRESERTLEGRVEARTRELQALLETSKALSSTLELQTVLDEILDQLKALVDCAGASVLLQEGEELVQLAVHRPSTAGPIDPSPARSLAVAHGLIWEAIRQGKPVMIEDVRAESPFADAYRAQVKYDLARTPVAYVRAWAAVPLMARDGVIGMLAMASETPGGLDERDVELAGAVAAQAAVAIQNAALYERTKVQAKETEALLRADAELFQTLSLNAVLQALVDVAVDVLGADKSIVVLHEGDIDVIRAARNYAPETRASFNVVLAGMPHEEPAPAGQEAHVYSDARLAPEYMAPTLALEGIASHISVPIRDAQRMLGAFSVSFVETHAFTKDEERLFMALADRAAVAIQNADLYERAQQAASLEERQRLARELHDSVSQALFGIALGAQTARLRLDSNPAAAVEPVEYVMSLAQAGLAEMRALIFELRPESLESEGLVAALEKQVAAAQARHNLPIETELCEEPDCRIEIKEALYRIAQEALNNVVKHAQASHVSVSLSVQDGALVLVVADNGVGFDATATYPGHVGLLSMPERAAKLGGTAKVVSSPGAGARVEAVIPVEPDLVGPADMAR